MSKVKGTIDKTIAMNATSIKNMATSADISPYDAVRACMLGNQNVILFEQLKAQESIAESLAKIANPLLHVDKDGAVSKVKEVPMCIKFDECGLTEEFCPTCDKYDDGTTKKDGDQDE